MARQVSAHGIGNPTDGREGEEGKEAEKARSREGKGQEKQDDTFPVKVGGCGPGIASRRAEERLTRDLGMDELSRYLSNDEPASEVDRV